MKIVFHTIMYFCLLMFITKTNANNSNILYQYQITFKQNYATQIEEAKNLVMRFAHTNDIVVIGNGNSIQLKTIYKINNNIFIGKFQKLNFPIEKIELQNQTIISDELKDKIEKFEKEKAAEIIKSGK